MFVCKFNQRITDVSRGIVIELSKVSGTHELLGDPHKRRLFLYISYKDGRGASTEYYMGFRPQTYHTQESSDSDLVEHTVMMPALFLIPKNWLLITWHRSMLAAARPVVTPED